MTVKCLARLYSLSQKCLLFFFQIPKTIFQWLENVTKHAEKSSFVIARAIKMWRSVGGQIEFQALKRLKNELEAQIFMFLSRWPNKGWLWSHLSPISIDFDKYWKISSKFCCALIFEWFVCVDLLIFKCSNALMKTVWVERAGNFG